MQYLFVDFTSFRYCNDNKRLQILIQIAKTMNMVPDLLTKTETYKIVAKIISSQFPVVLLWLVSTPQLLPLSQKRPLKEETLDRLLLINIEAPVLSKRNPKTAV